MPEAEDSPSTNLHPIATALPPIIQTALAARQPMTARQIAADITKSHKHLIERLAAVPPNELNPFLAADEQDLQLRADALRCNLRAMEQYVVAFMRDTNGYTHAMQFERKRLDHLFGDLIGDCVGTIEEAVARLQEERASRAA